MSNGQLYGGAALASFRNCLSRGSLRIGRGARRGPSLPLIPRVTAETSWTDEGFAAGPSSDPVLSCRAPLVLLTPNRLSSAPRLSRSGSNQPSAGAALTAPRNGPRT